MKSLTELTLLDRFLFDQATQNPDVCKAMIELAISREIGDIQIATKEKTIEPFYGLRGIRLDILALDEDCGIYDLEMQEKKKANLPRRSRYYQAQIDISMLEPGEPDFDQLKDTCIIFICPFDLFNENKYRYIFRPKCDEVNGLGLNDGTVRIFLNTKGTNDNEVPEELVEFLHYIDRLPSDNLPIKSSKIQAIDTYIQKIKSSHEMGVKYMDRLYEEMMWKKEAREEGLAEGRAEGRMLFLISQVRKKILKNKESLMISEELEEEPAIIQSIYDCILANSGQSDEAIYQILKSH